MEQKFITLLDAKCGKPFRRSELATLLYPLSAPRSRPVADSLAETIINQAFRAGKIVRSGHLHWVSNHITRKLISGRTVPELSVLVDLPITTRCPEKWLSVDLETGAIWLGTQKGSWQRAPASIAAELKAILSKTK